MGQRRKPLVLLITAFGMLCFMVSTSGASAAACQSSQPSSGLYSATVCIESPADGQTLNGLAKVTARVSISVRNLGVQRVTFSLDGTYLLTDYQAPFEFLLPTNGYANGPHVLTLSALLRDQFTTEPVAVNIVFRNERIEQAAITQSGVWASPPKVSGRPIVVAVTGDGASGEANAGKVTDLISSWNPDLFLYLGDVYERGTYTEFYNWYGTRDSLFGRFSAKTAPVVGNHEYSDGKPAPGYFEYWGNVPSYYSFDIGGWHFIALNSTSESRLAKVGSQQYTWLEADLQTSKSACTAVFFHHPVFSVGPHGATDYMADFWPLFIREGVDLVLTGHDHNYQRWVALDDAGNPNPNGLPQLVLGAGGHGVRPFTSKDPRLAFGLDKVTEAVGAMRLELTDEGASFNYVNIAGAVLDSGSYRCREKAASGLPGIGPGLAQQAGSSRSVSGSSLQAGTATQPTFPIRAAFYYGWYPQNWGSDSKPDSKYEPALGRYDSMNAEVVKRHIEAMRYGNIQAGIASWWGRGHSTDSQFPLLLAASGDTSFRWAIYYEPEGEGDPTVSRIASDLTYLNGRFGSHSGYLRIEGRPVIFVYGDGKDDCTMADRWKQANTINAYVVLKVFPGYKACQSQPDAWHQYAPANATDSQLPNSFTISPGFNKPGEEPRLTRDLDRWRRNISDMIQSKADFQLITSFNEWIEGTSIESAKEWKSASGFGQYLDVLHEFDTDESDPEGSDAHYGKTGADSPPYLAAASVLALILLALTLGPALVSSLRRGSSRKA